MKKIKLLTPILTGTLVASSLISITSCNTNTLDTITEQLVSSSISEFKEFAKHPRPSQGLVEIQQYLKNWINTHGWTFMQDAAGNIWFDVPATSGKEKYPKAILQGHMDMVFSYDKSQTVEGGGTKEVPSALTHMIEIVEDKDTNGRAILHSKDYFTSIGADDGIGVAMIMAIITNPNISHGPLRVIWTADEEIGLVGAKNLSRVALDGYNYLLNFDGESKANAEDMICTGCQGYCEYKYNHEFDVDTSAPVGNQYRIEIKGLKGGHCMDQEWIKYQTGGIVNVGANADKMMLMILDALQSNNKNVQISSYNHYDQYGDEVSYDPRKLPESATAVIYTDYGDIVTVRNLIDDVINDEFKAKYPYEDWDNVSIQVILGSSATTQISSDYSRTLINLFGNTIQSDILIWEGDTDAEKVEKNYPLKTSNVSSFKLVNNDDGKKLFTIGTRGCAGKTEYLDELKSNMINSWTALGFSKDEITTIKDYYPWDTTSTHKLVDTTEAAFKSFNVTPKLQKTRGGVEPAFFSTAKPGLEQLVIGPRIDDIHTPLETLYVDTIYNTMKAALIVIQTINEIK